MQARSSAFVIVGIILAAGGYVLVAGIVRAPQPLGQMLVWLGGAAVAAGFIGLVFAPAMDRIVRQLSHRQEE